MARKHRPLTANEVRKRLASVKVNARTYADLDRADLKLQVKKPAIKCIILSPEGCDGEIDIGGFEHVFVYAVRDGEHELVLSAKDRDGLN